MKIHHLLIAVTFPAILMLTGCEAEKPLDVVSTEPAVASTPVTAQTTASVAKIADQAAASAIKADHCAKHQLADSHDCIKHCAQHKGKKDKICKKHCENKEVAEHDCAKHCKDHGDVKDKVCAEHCANDASAAAHACGTEHCSHHEGLANKSCDTQHCSKHKGSAAHQCSQQHCEKHGGNMADCCGGSAKCEMESAKPAK